MCRTLYATLLCACLAQAGARRETIKEHDPSEDDVCSSVVDGSMKRDTFDKQTEKCKCPRGYFLLGENAACQTLSRYFNPSDVEGLGCACTTCSEVVANSNMRITARKQESEKCKCPKAQIVSGDDEACFSFQYSRYFDPSKLVGKDCQCWDAEQIKARTTLAETTSSTTTTQLNQSAPVTKERSPAEECDAVCEEVYKDAVGMSYKGACKNYCELKAAGEDPCSTCKYVTDRSGYHKSCRFFMTAFLNPENTDCYHKPLNSDTCADEMFMDDTCSFVGFDVVKKAQDNEVACSEAYAGAQGMTYESSCKQYAKLAAEGADPCEVCKYVLDRSGYHKACRFFMTSFHDPEKETCYHKPLNTETCPEETFLDPECGFVGMDKLHEAKEQGLI